MWKVIHMARSEQAARQTAALLEAEGILVKLKPVYRNVPAADNYFEVQVLTAEAALARDVLLEKGL